MRPAIAPRRLSPDSGSRSGSWSCAGSVIAGHVRRKRRRFYHDRAGGVTPGAAQPAGWSNDGARARRGTPAGRSLRCRPSGGTANRRRARCLRPGLDRQSQWSARSPRRTARSRSRWRLSGFAMGQPWPLLLWGARTIGCDGQFTCERDHMRPYGVRRGDEPARCAETQHISRISGLVDRDKRWRPGARRCRWLSERASAFSEPARHPNAR